MLSPQLLQPVSQLSAPLPQLVLHRQQSPLVLSDLCDELGRPLQDDHLGRFVVACHRWDFVPQNHEAHLQLVPSLPLQHIVSPTFVVVVLSVRPRAPAPAAAARPGRRAGDLRLDPFHGRLLAGRRGLLGGVVVLLDVDVGAFEHQRGGFRALGHLSPVYRHHVDLFILLLRRLFFFWGKIRTFVRKCWWSLKLLLLPHLLLSTSY